VQAGAALALRGFVVAAGVVFLALLLVGVVFFALLLVGVVFLALLVVGGFVLGLELDGGLMLAAVVFVFVAELGLARVGVAATLVVEQSAPGAGAGGFI
jgi:uncharacterized RDD family membrane protein YckC